MSPGETRLRRDLSAAYQLAARRGWDDIVWTHISAALSDEPGTYLINRFGLRFDEIDEHSLVKVDVQGRVLDGSGAPVNPSGFAIHGAVHAARPDAVCVLHLHTLWGQTFAATNQALLPCSQPATRLWRRLGRHAYEGLAFEPAERERLVAALGKHDGLILENHGTLTVGRTVGEAFVLMHWLERAIQIQMTAMATGTLKCMSDDVAMRTQQQWLGDGSQHDGADEWPALLRSLDVPAPPR